MWLFFTVRKSSSFHAKAVSTQTIQCKESYVPISSQPPPPWVTSALTPALKWPEREADYSSPRLHTAVLS